MTWYLWACLEAEAVLKAAERQSVVVHILREKGGVFWPLLPKRNGKHMQHIVTSAERLLGSGQVQTNSYL